MDFLMSETNGILISPRPPWFLGTLVQAKNEDYVSPSFETFGNRNKKSFTQMRMHIAIEMGFLVSANLLKRNPSSFHLLYTDTNDFSTKSTEFLNSVTESQKFGRAYKSEVCRVKYLK